jgi:hypothetical protein
MINLAFKIILMVGFAHFLPIEEEFFFVSNGITEASDESTTTITALVPEATVSTYIAFSTSNLHYSTQPVKTSSLVNSATQTSTSSIRSTRIEILFVFIGMSLLILVIGYKTIKCLKRYHSKNKQDKCEMPAVVFFPRTSTANFSQNISQGNSDYVEFIENKPF